MQETLTFPTLGSPPRFTFPELHINEQNPCYSELSSSTSTPYVSAPSSPSRMKGFYFSAPTSPTWAQRTLLLQEGDQGHSTSSFSAKPLHTEDHRSSNWAQQAPQTGYHRSSNWAQQSPQTGYHSSSNWAQQSPQTESHSSSPLSPKSLQTEYDRSSNWAQPPQKSLQTESHNRSTWFQRALETEHGRSPCPTEDHTRSTNWYQKDMETEYERSPSPTRNNGRSIWCQSASRTAAHERSPRPSDTKDSHSPITQKLHPIITNLPKHKPLKRLQVEDLDASYSRKSFYASAVPFSWEEKPGTPKARSVASETSNGEDDSASAVLSGSSEFEFSARFSELEDLPMSPTPISSTFNSFKNQSAHGSPSPTYKLGHADSHAQSEAGSGDQIWPLRPPPCLDNPVLPMKQLMRDDASEHKHGYRLLSSLSAPQSPRSPRIFDIRGVFCGISSPVADAVFDPFVAAMEKSMGDDEEMRKSVRKDTSRASHGHHRRAQSLSPLRVFHWDDHSAKMNSTSSNGSSCTDEVKNKHPIQIEIDARHSAGTPKGSKRWSFKGFLHRKSVSGSGGESSRHSSSTTTSASLRSSGRESCGSPAMGREVGMADVSYVDENTKVRGAHMCVNSPTTYNSSLLSSIPSSPSSILSSSSSGNSTSRGKIKANKAPLALHYSMQRAQTEELRKKTFLPYKQGLLGCLGLSSKSYRALATISKPLQSVS